MFIVKLISSSPPQPLQLEVILTILTKSPNTLSDPLFLFLKGVLRAIDPISGVEIRHSWCTTVV